MCPQLNREEAVHGNERHFGFLVDLLPQAAAHVHSAGKAECRLSDVFREHRDDGHARGDRHRGKALPVQSPKMILPFIKVTTVESLDIVGEKEIHLEPQSIG